VVEDDSPGLTNRAHRARRDHRCDAHGIHRVDSVMSGTDSRLKASCRPSFAGTTSFVPSTRTLPKVWAALMAGAVSIGVVGCSAIDPVEISEIDGNLAVAFCFADSITSLSILQRGADDKFDDWDTEIAHNESVMNLRAGTPIEIGDGLLDAEDPDAVLTLPGTSYSVDFTTGDDLSLRSAFIEVPESGLVAGTWVRSDGSTRPDPCGVRQ
jgi:hypothetical protein